MTYWLSRPVEALPSVDGQSRRINTLIIGSGYGAAMAALALSESTESVDSSDSASQNDSPDANSQAERIVVFERGDEYLPQDFPRTLGELPRYTPTNISGKATNALWDVRSGKGAVSISGNGLGGTSLVNASVAVAPDRETLDHWPAPDGGADWHTLFLKCYPKIYALLGVNRIEKPERFAKFNALRNTVNHLDPSADVNAAPVAINFDGGGIHSVDHKPCNHCGNCVIGCHSGAKQSLNMNAWPLAVQQGVELYTGARVLRLTKLGTQWRVTYHSSRTPDTRCEVIADRVILAAGSIGSTEILHRSMQPLKTAKGLETALCLSEMLGKKFSANGDGLIFTSGERHRVEAVADVPDETASGACGPTIIGIARTSEHASSVGRTTIEDGAIPYPLAEIWRETLTMQSYVRRFVTDRRSAWHSENNTHDYLATSNDFTRHSQVLLTMGFDGSAGCLVADNDTGNMLPTWPNKKDSNGYYAKLHHLFSSKEPTAYAGGEYHPNPLYQLLPAAFDQVFEGTEHIPSQVVTVHPLGGCCIGESSLTGVINHNGQVYRCDDLQDQSAVYENLYVLDGAALPGPVGVNPMITISALAYTLASRIAGRAVPAEKPFARLHEKNRTLPQKIKQPVSRDKTINAKFSERLLWDIRALSTLDKLDLQKTFQDKIPEDAKTVVLDITFYFDDESCEEQHFNNSLDKWLCNPTKPLRASALLRASDRELLHGSADTFVPMPVLMKFTGTVTLGSRDKQGDDSLLYRTTSAINRFFFYRPSAVFSTLRRAGGNRREMVDETTASASYNDKVSGFLRVAKLHAQWRYLEYQLVESDCRHEPLKLNGRKRLAYALLAPSLWQSLLFLPVHFSRGNVHLKARFAVDLLRITRGPSPLQITKSSDEPSSVAAVAGVGMLLTRLIGTTHFWSFGAHKYADFESSKEIDEKRTHEPPEVMFFKRDDKTFSSLSAEIYNVVEEPNADGNQAAGDLLSRLVRYREDESDRPAVLLVHGLSHSSEIYWPQHVKETYVQFLLKRGYDVWVFDHRTSANTRKEIDVNHTWDDIALIDVPWAVNKVFTTINASTNSSHVKLVNVFAHCIGAGSVAMAVLAGRLQQPGNDDKSMLGSLIPHAVTPWVFSSCENRTRANLWGFVKDFGLLDKIDPRMHSEPTFLHTILDRIASSTIDLRSRLQWSGFKRVTASRQRAHEYASAMYFRYTVFWGKQWVHKNVTDGLKRRFPYMVGEVPAGILQQTYFGVRRKRLVNKDALNKYVTEPNFEDYWKFPTLFLHGEMNQVFDVESSRLSAYKLAHLRSKKSDRAFAISEFAQHGVWLHTQAQYGHMDMIIGDNATNAVGPVVDRFFKVSEKQNSEWNRKPSAEPSYDVFKAAYINSTLSEKDLPLTRTTSGKRPFTGPVLSYANKESLRIWAEADDYDTEPSSGLSVLTEGRCELDTVVKKAECSEEAAPSSFHAVEINNPSGITNSIEVRIKHDDNINQELQDSPLSHTGGACSTQIDAFEELCGSQNFSRQRDIDPEQGATIDLSRMPWFKRLYHNASGKHDRDVVNDQDISFAVGSCLHPGLTFSRDQSDSIFNSLLQQIVGPGGVDFLLLLGDQIYADATGGLFDPKAPYERFRMRYREAYGGRYFRQVLSHVPTYFVVDDHAYRDNFSGLKGTPDSDLPDSGELEIAKAEARNFQTHLNNTEELWSDFEVHGQPFFCFDTRFERQNKKMCDRSERIAIIGDEQAEAFEEWVEKNKHKKTLFLCTGSPLFPIQNDVVQYPVLSSSSDTLIAYPGFLAYLIDKLGALDCKIIMLSGDPHLSCHGSGTLSYRDHVGRIKQLTIETIVSSPLHAPFPFANARASDYLWGTEQVFDLPDNGLSVRFRQELLSTAAQQFCRIDYHGESGDLQVRVYGSDALETDASGITYT